MLERRIESDQGGQVMRGDSKLHWDYMLLLVAALMGYSAAPWATIFVIGALLTALAPAKHLALARQYSELGAVRVFAMSVGANFANNLLFSAIAYCLGRGTVWLISQ